MSSTSVWLDDRDARIQFVGVWPLGGSPTEFEGTVSSSTRVGDTMVVPFYGRSIVVFGTIDATSGGVVTNYTIDNMPTVQVTSQRGTGDTFHQQFWASPVLNVTEHTLNITMAKVNPDPEPGEGTIWFDYFVINDPSGHEGRVPSKRGLSTGGIIGVVLGAVVFLVIMLLAVVCWVRHRRKRRNLQDHNEDKVGKIVPWKAEELTGNEESPPMVVLTDIELQNAQRNGIEPYVLSSPAENNVQSSLPSKKLASNKGRWSTKSPGASIRASQSAASPPRPPSANATAQWPVPAHHHDTSTSGLSSNYTGHVTSAATLGNVESSEQSDIDQGTSNSHHRHDSGSMNPRMPDTAVDQNQTPIQHVDSGVRQLAAEAAGTNELPTELPPVYSPT